MEMHVAVLLAFWDVNKENLGRKLKKKSLAPKAKVKFLESEQFKSAILPHLFFFFFLKKQKCFGLLGTISCFWIYMPYNAWSLPPVKFCDMDYSLRFELGKCLFVFSGSLTLFGLSSFCSPWDISFVLHVRI